MEFFTFIIAAQSFTGWGLWSQVGTWILVVVGLFFSHRSLDAKVKEKKQEEKDKMATKGFVKQEVAKVEVQHLHLVKDVGDFKEYTKKEIAENKADNEREHDRIWDETNKKLDNISSDIKILLSKLGGKK